MNNDELQSIERLLDEGEHAEVSGDWHRVKVCAEEILRFDPHNDYAKGYLRRPEVRWFGNKQLHEELDAAKRLNSSVVYSINVVIFVGLFFLLVIGGLYLLSEIF